MIGPHTPPRPAPPAPSAPALRLIIGGGETTPPRLNHLRVVA